MSAFIRFFTQYPSLVFLVTVALVFTCLPFSTQSAAIEQLKTWHATYGLPALFMSSLVEGFLFFGLYYIGSAFIIVAVLLAQGNVVTLFQIIVTVWSALTIMSVINFTIGKHGYVTMQTPPLPSGRWGVLAKPMLFLHPTLIAYQAYKRGQTGYSYWSLIYISAGTFLAGVFYVVVITLTARLFT